MSYARFCYSSQVYVFADTSGGIECCGCMLLGNFHSDTAEGMAAHLREHIAAGHKVEVGTIEDILADREFIEEMAK